MKRYLKDLHLAFSFYIKYNPKILKNIFGSQQLLKKKIFKILHLCCGAIVDLLSLEF